MNSSETRSSEKIIEYFELLQWYNKLGVVRNSSSQDILNSDKVANGIKESIDRFINTKTSLDIDFHKLCKRLEAISYELNHIHSTIFKNNAEISLLDESISNKRNKYVDFSQEPTSVLSIRNQRKTIFLLLLNDIKRSSFFSRIHVLNTIPKVFTICVFIVVTLPFLLKILESNNTLYKIIIFIYFLLLSILLFTLVELIYKYIASKLREVEYLNHSGNIKDKSEINLIDSHNSGIISEKNLYQTLKSEQEKLEHRKNIIIEEHTLRKSELERIRANINKAESSISSKKLEYSEIEKGIDSKLQKLIGLEKAVEIWLSDDISSLKSKVMEDLNIKDRNEDGTNITQLNVLNRDPFSICVGISKNEKNEINKRRENSAGTESLIIESDGDRSLKSLEKTGLSIDRKDFYREKKYESSSTDAFGVYEFVAIFLCSNFLTYYRCYFNFIQNESIDAEDCEYLYDSIVSVKVQAKSRIGGDSSRKRTYRKRLLITTSDGKVVCFRFSENRRERGLSTPFSDFDDAAPAIREMLRQRRIDVLLTSEQDDF